MSMIIPYRYRDAETLDPTKFLANLAAVQGQQKRNSDHRFLTAGLLWDLPSLDQASSVQLRTLTLRPPWPIYLGKAMAWTSGADELEVTGD